MKEITTPPIVGDKILDEFKDKVFEKYVDENNQITGIKIWPAAAIEESYRKAAGGIGGPNEAQALKTFYMEMVHYLRTGTYETFDLEEEEYILTLLEGETA